MNSEHRQLPLLPGYTFKDFSKRNFHRSQTLLYANGYPCLQPVELGAPVRRMSSLENVYNGGNKNTLVNNGFHKTKQVRSKSDPANPWDVKILRFDAYFKEDVQNSNYEGFRIRRVNIYYYVQDDSIAIYEPRTENSGLRQGKVLRRQKVPKSDGVGYWHWTDLNLALTVQVYGVPYRILNCDEWTKNFLFTNGVILNDPEELPVDPYQSRRLQQKQLQKPTFTTPTSEDKLWKFLNYDRQVLRFYSLLEETRAGKGEKETRPVVLQYYLVDDTIEIRESHQPNDGIDPFPIAFRRQRVPKNGKTQAAFPIAAIDDLLRPTEEFITPKDLGLGKLIDIFGRRLLICDCDDFTKEHYKRFYGVQEFSPLNIPKPEEAAPKLVTPPYNGFGSPEDSVQSCFFLTPRAPKKNLVQFLENDTKVLRFQAVFDTPIDSVDKGRKFIISYFLADDTIGIYEPSVTNSGVLGGKFQDRRRQVKPGTDLTHPDYYHFNDLYIGSLLESAGRVFRLIAADRYVHAFIKRNATEYPSRAIEAMNTAIQENGQ